MIRKNYDLIVLPRTNLQESTPVMTIDSEVDGPLVWLTARIHGDEVSNGVVVYDLFDELSKKDSRYTLVKGRINAFPIVNTSGAKIFTRNLPESTENLNTCFPGKENGTFGEIIANWFFKKITETHPALVLDLHNDWSQSVPYGIIDPNIEKINDGAYNLAKQYALSSGLIITQEREPIDGCLSLNLLKANIPSMTLEVGGYLVIDERNINCGVDAIFNILKSMGMVEDKNPEIQRIYNIPEQVKGRILFYSDQPAPSCMGISRPKVPAGTFVKKGTTIAKIIGWFGNTLENIVAVEDGIVLGPSGHPQVYPGTGVMASGLIR